MLLEQRIVVVDQSGVLFQRRFICLDTFCHVRLSGEAFVVALVPVKTGGALIDAQAAA